MKAMLKKRTRASAESHKADYEGAMERCHTEAHPRHVAAAVPSIPPCVLHGSFRGVHVSNRHSLSVTTTRSSRKTVFSIQPMSRTCPREKSHKGSDAAILNVDLLCEDTLDVLDVIDAVDAVSAHASKVQVIESKSLSTCSQVKINDPSDPSYTQRANIFKEYHINFAMLAILNMPDFPLLHK